MFWISLHSFRSAFSTQSGAHKSRSEEECGMLRFSCSRFFYWNHPITITNDTVTWKRLFSGGAELEASTIRWEDDEMRWDSKGCFLFLSSIPEDIFSSSFFLILRWHFSPSCLPLCKSLVKAWMSVGGPLDEERRVGRGEVSIKLSDTPWQGMKRTEHFQLLRNVKNHPPDPADMLPKKKFFFLLRATRFYIKSTLIISKHERTEKKTPLWGCKSVK